MDKSSCEDLLQYYPRITELEDLRWTYIGNCVFSICLRYTAIMLNIITIHAMRKISSLPKTLKTLLLSLAVSDIGVGLLSQPFYAAVLIKWLQKDVPSCKILNIYIFFTCLFSMPSFFGVVGITVDRFLAIHLHLRYLALVTHKRVVAMVISVWMFSAVMSLTLLWVPPSIRVILLLTAGVAGLVFTVIIYSRIYLTVRRHRQQIQVLQVQQPSQTHAGQMVNFASVSKSASAIFYVYLLFSVCYSPFFTSMAAIRIYGPNISLKRFYLSSSTLVNLNSSLNPIIYCWKMRYIRHAIMAILWNLFLNRNHATHL